MSFSLQIPNYGCSETHIPVTTTLMSPLVISAERPYSDYGNVPSDQYVNSFFNETWGSVQRVSCYYESSGRYIKR